MPSTDHDKKVEYMRRYFESRGFHKIEVNGLESELYSISRSKKGVRPDILMIWRESNVDLTQACIRPLSVEINWCEVVDSSFQGFPERQHVKEALLHTLRMKELYGQDILRKTFGEKTNTTKKISEMWEKPPSINLFYFLVSGNTIYRLDIEEVIPDDLEFKKEPIARR